MLIIVNIEGDEMILSDEFQLFFNIQNFSKIFNLNPKDGE